MSGRWASSRGKRMGTVAGTTSEVATKEGSLLADRRVSA